MQKILLKNTDLSIRFVYKHTKTRKQKYNKIQWLGNPSIFVFLSGINFDDFS